MKIISNNRWYLVLFVLGLALFGLALSVGPTPVSAHDDHGEYNETWSGDPPSPMVASDAVVISPNQSIDADVNTNRPVFYRVIRDPGGAQVPVFNGTVNGTEGFAYNGSYANDYGVQFYSSYSWALKGFSINVVSDSVVAHWVPTDHVPDSESESELTDPDGTTYDGSGECGPSDFLKRGVSTLDNGTPCNYDKWDGTNNYTDSLEWYQHGVSVHAADVQYRNQIDNWLEVTDQLAFSAAERRIAQAAANDTSQAFAVTAAKSVVKDYYSAHQADLINHWNQQITSLDALNNTNTYSDTAMDPDAIIVGVSHSITTHYQSDNLRNGTLGTYNLTLANGTTMETMTFDVNLSGQYSTDDYTHATQFTHYQTIRIDSGDTFYNHTWTEGSLKHRIDFEFTDVTMEAPSGYQDKKFIWYEGYADDWRSIENQSEAVVNDTETFTSNVWSDIKNDVVSPPDLLSRVNQMYNYAVYTDGDNSTLNQGVAGLFASGFSSPTFNDPQSAYMNISHSPAGSSNTYNATGFLFSTHEPENSSWEMNFTYNASNVTGAQFFVDFSGNRQMLDGNFTIHDVFTRNGTRVINPSLSSPSVDYSAGNTSELQDLISDLGDRIQQLNNWTADKSGGGTDGGDDGPTKTSLWDTLLNVLGVSSELMVIIIVALVGAWFFLATQ